MSINDSYDGGKKESHTEETIDHSNSDSIENNDQKKQSGEAADEPPLKATPKSAKRPQQVIPKRPSVRNPLSLSLQKTEEPDPSSSPSSISEESNSSLPSEAAQEPVQSSLPDNTDLTTPDPELPASEPLMEPIEEPEHLESVEEQSMPIAEGESDHSASLSVESSEPLPDQEPRTTLEEENLEGTNQLPAIKRQADQKRKPSISDNGHEKPAAMAFANEFRYKSQQKASSHHGLNGNNHILPVAKGAAARTKSVSSRSRVAVAEPYRPQRSREIIIQRRKRVNRVLMHKRHHSRFYDTLLTRLMVVALVLLAILIVMTSGAGGVAYAYYQAQLPLLDGIAQHSLAQTTNIYDRNGKLLYQLYDHSNSGGRRTYVNFEDIPNALVNATIAAEDHSFWNNSGVDYNGILRAVITNFQHGSVQEGGSTVTQQLIKNQFFLNQDRTLQVKGEEAILATGLTQRYTKAQIMEMYLNTVFYGDSNFGVEAAAQDYFGLKPHCKKGVCKPAVAQLTLGQASLLAGLPQSPTGYMPFTNKDAALQRQQHVLQNMLSLKMITTQQMEAAQKEIQNFKFKRPAYVKNAPHFVDYVVDSVLIPLFGAYNLRNGGYSIYTTLDLDLERQVEKIVYNRIDGNEVDIYGYGNLRTAHNLHNASVVVTDPKTGELLAMDGSVNYNDQSNDPAMAGQYNAANTLRPPGSSFKPIVYATAFEMGWYPAMNVPDHNTYYPDGQKPYNPPNYDHKFHGDNMTIRRGVSNSYNIPAVDAIEYAGVKNVMTMAGRLGLSHVAQTAPGRQGAAMALGVSEDTLLNMTTAYATFANGGVRMPQTTVLQINDNQGRPIYKFDAQHAKGERVLGEDVSFLISSMLSDTVARHEEFPSPNPLELDGRPVAAKTGTTDNFADNWTMGYTPHLAVGVWAGNSDNSPMENVIGITGAGPIWQDVFQYANTKYHFPKDGFTPPPNVHQATVSAYTGLLPHLGEPTVTDWFIDGTVPTVQGIYTPPPPVVRPPKDGKKDQNPADAGNGQNPADAGNGQNPADAGNGQNPADAGNGQNPANANNGQNPANASNGQNPSNASNGN